jgi:hypothetical protein
MTVTARLLEAGSDFNNWSQDVARNQCGVEG